MNCQVACLFVIHSGIAFPFPARRSLREPLLEVPEDPRVVRQDHEGVRIGLRQDLPQVRFFIFGENGHENVRILFGVSALAFPGGHAAAKFPHDDVRDPLLLGEDHRVELDVLHVDLVDEDARHDGKDDRIHHRLDVIEEQADRVDAHADDDPDRADLEVRMCLGQADADQVLPALRTARAKHQSRADAGSEATGDRGQDVVFHDRHPRHRDDRQERRGHHDGDERGDAELPPHDPVGHDEERHIDQEIDDAHVIHSADLRNVEELEEERPDQLRDSGEPSAVQVDRRDHEIDARCVDEVADDRDPGTVQSLSAELHGCSVSCSFDCANLLLSFCSKRIKYNTILRGNKADFRAERRSGVSDYAISTIPFFICSSIEPAKRVWYNTVRGY